MCKHVSASEVRHAHIVINIIKFIKIINGRCMPGIFMQTEYKDVDHSKEHCEAALSLHSPVFICN